MKNKVILLLSMLFLAGSLSAGDRKLSKDLEALDQAAGVTSVIWGDHVPVNGTSVIWGDSIAWGTSTLASESTTIAIIR